MKDLLVSYIFLQNLVCNHILERSLFTAGLKPGTIAAKASAKDAATTKATTGLGPGQFRLNQNEVKSGSDSGKDTKEKNISKISTDTNKTDS